MHGILISAKSECNGNLYHIVLYKSYQPKGGVKKGQIFQSPVLHIDSKSVFDPTGRTKRLTDMHTPSSQWRSGVCSIYSHGVFHPMAVNSLLCTYGKLFDRVCMPPYDIYSHIMRYFSLYLSLMHHSESSTSNGSIATRYSWE